MTMADTVAVMNKGAIEQMGAPEQLYDLPKTAFVANFLGQSNLFTGDVVGSTSEAISISAGGSRITVPSRRAERHQGTITVGVRPEKVTLHREAPADAASRNVLGPARVIDASFSGVSTQYVVDVPGLGSIVVFAQNISGSIAHEGDEVWLSWAIEHGFGLADAAPEQPRFDSDADTTAIAAQHRAALATELEEG